MAETVKPKPVVFKIEAKVRLAENRDLLIGPKLLKLFQPYYVYCDTTKTIEGVFIIDAFTNSKKLEELFLAKKIYVPIPDWDDTIRYQLQQEDLRHRKNHGNKIS